MPVIRLAEAVGEVPIGATVRLLADDETARVDVPVWCRMQRHVLTDVRDEPSGGTAYVVTRRH
jgi:cysteine desulfurase